MPRRRSTAHAAESSPHRSENKRRRLMASVSQSAHSPEQVLSQLSSHTKCWRGLRTKCRPTISAVPGSGRRSNARSSGPLPTACASRGARLMDKGGSLWDKDPELHQEGEKQREAYQQARKNGHDQSDSAKSYNSSGAEDTGLQLVYFNEMRPQLDHSYLIKHLLGSTGMA